MAAWLSHANFLTQQMKRLEQTDISAHQAVDLNQFLQNLREKAQASFANREVMLAQQEQLPAIEADPQELEENLSRGHGGIATSHATQGQGQDCNPNP